MYRCKGCTDIVSDPGFCFCGKLRIDRKLRAIGEHFELVVPSDEVTTSFTESLTNKGTDVQEKKVYEKAKVRTCPECGWEGFVIPCLKKGCPEHGIWWYKKDDRHSKPMVKEKTDDTDETAEQFDCGRHNRGNRGAGRKDKPRHDKNRKAVSKIKRKR